ncbi:MAG: hypothetical protein AAGJ53_08740, partial [Pseudomonadota bacterium]
MARRFTVRERARSDAFRIAAFLEELAVPSPTAVSIFEVGDGWQIDAYFEHDDAPDDEAKLSEAVTPCAMRRRTEAALRRRPLRSSAQTGRMSKTRT